MLGGQRFPLTLFISDQNVKRQTLLKETAFAHRFKQSGGHRRQRQALNTRSVSGDAHPTDNCYRTGYKYKLKIKGLQSWIIRSDS